MMTEIPTYMQYGAFGLLTFIIVFDRVMLFKELKQVLGKLGKVLERIKK